MRKSALMLPRLRGRAVFPSAGGVEPVVLVAVLQADGMDGSSTSPKTVLRSRRRGPASARRTRPPAPRRRRAARAAARRNGSSYRAALAWWTSWPGPLSTSSSTTSYVAGRPRRRPARRRRPRRATRSSASSRGPWGMVPSRIHSTSAGSISTTSHPLDPAVAEHPVEREAEPQPADQHPPRLARPRASAASASACSEACSEVSITKTPFARSSSTVGPPPVLGPGGARAARARRGRSHSVRPRRTPRIYRRRPAAAWDLVW